MRPDELERILRERLKAMPPAARAELLYVLMLPDFERAGRIGEFYGNPKTPHLRRVPDRLRGGSGGRERCWWGCWRESPRVDGGGTGASRLRTSRGMVAWSRVLRCQVGAG